jgi:hypothetical protein
MAAIIDTPFLYLMNLIKPKDQVLENEKVA